MVAASLSDVSSRITDPEQLKELLGIPFTPEQTACITAPPAPQVIVAGAGSGKTTVMAARVVWLVGTGQVAPEQVLGLTFTNKAAGELAERVRKALVARRRHRPRRHRPGQPAGRARASPRTTPSPAAPHGPRPAHRPGAHRPAARRRHPLPARRAVLREAPGPYPALTRSFPTLVSDLLALDGELVRAPGTARGAARVRHRAAARAGERQAHQRRPAQGPRGRRGPPRTRSSWSSATGPPSASRDLLDFGDQIALSAELALTRPEVGAILRDEFRVVLLDEYQDTSVAQRLLLSGLFGARHRPRR